MRATIGLCIAGLRPLEWHSSASGGIAALRALGCALRIRRRNRASPGRLIPNLSSAKTKRTSFRMSFCFGGDKRDRTADLLNAIQALSQLSYTPICSCVPLGTKFIIADGGLLVKGFRKNI